MTDATPLASLSLTHVYYDPDDNVSLLCAWLALLPQALCVVYATLIFSTREAEVALMFAGQLGCEAVNFALKRLIKEERPARIHGKGYGMPSSHAQFVAYWSVFLVLFLLVRHTPPAVVRNNHKPFSRLERILGSIFAVSVGAAVAWSRIYLGYHTPKQVFVGWLAGALSAIAWFVITAVARDIGLLAWGLETPPARWLRFRDLVVEEDLCQAGWEKWEDKLLEAQKKKGR